MYKSVYYDRFSGLIHLWDDVDGYDCFTYKPYAYRFDPDGQFRTMTGLPVSKVTNWSKHEELEGLVFEHDIPPATRVLIDRYYKSDDVSTGHSILFFDIEVSKNKKYSRPSEASNPITSIAYYDNISKRYTCLLVSNEMESSESIEYDLVIFSTERDLLRHFLKVWKIINPTIITGWHSDGFDIPYLYNRIKSVLSPNDARKLSPIGIVYPDTHKGTYTIKIAGVSSMDYLILYRKFTYNEEPSYKLEAISQKELGEGKIAYDGTLDQLYQSDVNRFIEYNIRDVELIVKLDAKLDFIAIAMGICHKGHVPYDDFQMSSRYLDGACITYCKRNNIVITGRSSREKNSKSRDAEGAFVKLPKSGLHHFVYDLDLESEYPNNIRTLNISPETKWGKIDNWDSKQFAKGQNKKYIVRRYIDQSIPESFRTGLQSEYEVDSDAIRSFMDEHRLAVSATGILYDTTNTGLVPAILTSWSAERKQFQREANEFHELKDYEAHKFYDRKQLVQKILLNSLYGVLLLPSFRFYDLENGESITITGQQLVQWSADMGNWYYNKHIEADTYIDYCIYQDTDSVGEQSMLRLPDGTRISISDMFDRYKDDADIIDASGREFVFPADLKLPCYNEVEHRIEFGNVKYIEKHTVKKRIFKIKTKSGKELIVSEDHSIMIMTDKGLVTKLTKDIAVGDLTISF